MNSRLHAFRTPLARAMVLPLLLIIGSLAFTTVNANSHERMSPFDEYVYID